MMKKKKEARKRGKAEKRKKQSVKIWEITHMWPGVVFIRGFLILVFSQIRRFQTFSLPVFPWACFCFEFRILNLRGPSRSSRLNSYSPSTLFISSSVRP